MSKFAIFFLIAVALACVGSAAAQFFINYPVAAPYYNPYGYTYPVSYGYRLGAYPLLLRR